MPPSPNKKAAIVVGSGLAGLSAASELIARQIPVRLLERAAKPGGNSIKASSGINGAPTKYQSLGDSTAGFYEDTVRSAGKVFSTTATAQRKKLVETLTGSSASAVSWLVDEKGVDLSHVAQLGGHSFPRTHRGAGKAPPPGYAIVSTLLNNLKTSELFTLETEAQVNKILTNETEVTGVEYTQQGETKQLEGPVIIAAGGFGGDADGMLAEYRPDLKGYPSTNDPRPGSQKLLTDVGAQLVDMDQVQVHPTGFVDPADEASPLKFLAAEVLRGEGGILLLPDGKRFVNEMETRKTVTDAITATPPLGSESPKQWDVRLVLEEGAFEAAQSHIGFYLFKGLMQKTTIADLPPAALSTIKEYSSIATQGKSDSFGRKTFGKWRLEPQDVSGETTVWVGRVTPVVHFTMGGVVVNERAEVLAKDGKGISGVWAAGEVTGGVHGENRLGGSSLLECVVFGRIAGEEVAKVWRGAV